MKAYSEPNSARRRKRRVIKGERPIKPVKIVLEEMDDIF